jgi:hypothetical protein
MRIMLARNWSTYEDRKVETYSGSMVRVLREKGHEVVDVPKGPQNYDGIDLVIDVDCGRDSRGNLVWLAEHNRLPVLSAVMLIDSHGWPTVHRRLARNYDHVFFAVWDKRDLFERHPSAHWCPNFTDVRWFNGPDYDGNDGGERFHFGFYGSRGGLDRADPMLKIAKKHGWRAEARQINKGGKHRWPSTSHAMARCDNLFNRSQKHDGPNLRVMESMLMNRPLLCDTDPRSGLEKLFTPGTHFIPYNLDYSGLEEAMKWIANHPKEAEFIATRAHLEVKENHLVENRLDQILEVVQA